jgi:hypothetical protein
MRAKPILTALGLVCVVYAASAEPPTPAPEPISVRVAVSDAVIVGRVSKVEGGTVKVRYGRDTLDWKAASVEVKKAVLGAEGGNILRVAFPPLVTPVEGQEALLFLRREAGRKYYILAPVMAWRVDKKSDAFADDLKQALAFAPLVADPEKGLRSKDAKARYLTAALLVLRYRSPLDSGKSKEVAIDPGQSRRILKELAAADWKSCPPEMARIHPLTLFPMLGATEKDGVRDWNTAEYSAAAEAWVKKHAGTYVLKKYVSDR